MSMETPNKPEAKKKFKVITTARGSKYTRLPDGRTQRYKEATKELQEPQDILVFIPPFNLIKDRALQLYPDVFKSVENEVQFIQIMLEYAQLSGKTIRVIDQENNVIESLDGVPDDQQLFLHFIDKVAKRGVFTLPVSREPKLGWLTYDSRYYKGDDGARMHEKHIGNAVVAIE